MGRRRPIATSTHQYRSKKKFSPSPRSLWSALFTFCLNFITNVVLLPLFFSRWLNQWYKQLGWSLVLAQKIVFKIYWYIGQSSVVSPHRPLRTLLHLTQTKQRFQLSWWWQLSAWRFRFKKRWLVWKATWDQTSWLAPLRWITSVIGHLLYPFYALFRYYPLSTLSALTLSMLILAGAYWVYDTIFLDLPDPYKLMSHRPILSTKITDRHGTLLYSIYKDENRTLIHLDELPLHVKYATVAIEDQHFYSHHGFDVEGITRAFVSNLNNDTVQGGSTITQQLVKNVFFSSDKHWRRKIKEVLVAVQVERIYTKDQILEMYLNQVAYGGSTYGIEEAAQRYFNKSARQLTLGEATLLAGLPQAPSVYSPFGPQNELAFARQSEVLRRMVEDGYITEEQAASAKKEKLVFNQDAQLIKAPHFVMYVRSLLAQKYGESMLTQNGLEVTTTLDEPLQEKAQEIVTSEVDALQRLHITNGAALVTNPQTGEILGMVGSRNYFDFEHDGQVNVTLRPRQPGSSIKPLTYALAFERGFSPASTIQDEPVVYNIAGSEPYSPKNYDGRYHGTVALREALASSYNIPAVKLLAQVGVTTLINKAEDLGVTTWKDRNRFGLALTLGAGEVPMNELAQIYGTFANHGYTIPLNPILQIKDAEGRVLYHNTCALEGVGCAGTRNFNPLVAAQITNVLSDNTARIPAFGAQSVLHIPGQEVAVKTGTTNNMKDNWTIGYTQNRLVAVWVGNNDSTPMSYVASGITGASPIWNKIMRSLLSPTEPHYFAMPDGLVKVTVCTQTGKPSCGECGPTREELFIAGTEPRSECRTPQNQIVENENPQPVVEPNVAGATTFLEQRAERSVVR